jgi:hypothetical protein
MGLPPALRSKGWAGIGWTRRHKAPIHRMMPAASAGARILFVPNWRVARELQATPVQRPNLALPREPYWFFRHFVRPPEVTVLDVGHPVCASLQDRFLSFYPAQALRAAFGAHRYDVIVVHGAQSAVALLPMLRGLARFAPPCIVIDPGCLNMARPERRVQFALTRRALGLSQHIVWHSSASKRFCEKRAPELAAKGSFVPFGIALDDLPAVTQVDGDYAVCLRYSARTWPLIADAFSQMRDIPLYLLSKQRGAVTHPATRLEEMPFAEYCRFVARARLVLLPLDDGWGSWGQTTLLHAMALRKPVIVSNVKPIRDYAQRGCVLVEPETPGAWAEQLRAVWHNADLREKMARGGFEAVASEFSEQRLGRELESVVDSVLRKHPGSAPKP